MRKKGPATPTLMASKQCKDDSVCTDVVPLLPMVEICLQVTFSSLSSTALTGGCSHSLCPLRERNMRLRDYSLGWKGMRRWGLHGVTKFLDKDPSDDITRGDGAGIMDYSRTGHLSTAWWTFSLSFSLIIARLLTAVWKAFSRLASLVGTSLPRVGCLVPVWHYKCLKVLSLGGFPDLH